MGDLAIYEAEEKQKLLQSGNQQTLKILKDEFKQVKFKVKVRVSSKTKDMAQFTDKLVNVLRQYLSTPQMFQDPVARKLFDQIIEASGLNPADYFGMGLQTPEAPLPESSTRPINELTKREVMA